MFGRVGEGKGGGGGGQGMGGRRSRGGRRVGGLSLSITMRPNYA